MLDKRVEDGHELARDHVQVHVERDVGPHFVQRRRLGHDQLAGKALVVLVPRLVVALRRRARRRLEVGGGGLLEARGHLPAGPGLGGDHERLRVLSVVGKREQSVEALGPLAVVGVVVAGQALEAVRPRAAQHEANHLLVVARSPADLVAHAVDHDARGLEFYKRVDDVADRALQRLAGLGTLHSHDELLHIRVVDEVALVQRPHKAEDHALQLRHVRAVEVDEDEIDRHGRTGRIVENLTRKRLLQLGVLEHFAEERADVGDAALAVAGDVARVEGRDGHAALQEELVAPVVNVLNLRDRHLPELDAHQRAPQPLDALHRAVLQIKAQREHVVRREVEL
mmetsp:Transcript_23247/g.78528  ORF Transcript_23247/g.78528 Transcript_23247/m.78528 type:complete len:340 (-) Transcript_23247:985-2004(-)